MNQGLTIMDELFTHNPRQALQFPTKKQAVAAARAIGWSPKDATEVDVMGFRLWVLADDHMRMLRSNHYEALLVGYRAAHPAA